MRKVHRSCPQETDYNTGQSNALLHPSDFAPVGIGDWFAIQGSFKTLLDKTLLELLDFFVDTYTLKQCRRCSHMPISFE